MSVSEYVKLSHVMAALFFAMTSELDRTAFPVRDAVRLASCQIISDAIEELRKVATDEPKSVQNG